MSLRPMLQFLLSSIGLLCWNNRQVSYHCEPLQIRKINKIFHQISSRCGRVFLGQCQCVMQFTLAMGCEKWPTLLQIQQPFHFEQPERFGTLWIASEGRCILWALEWSLFQMDVLKVGTAAWTSRGDFWTQYKWISHVHFWFLVDGGECLLLE